MNFEGQGCTEMTTPLIVIHVDHYCNRTPENLANQVPQKENADTHLLKN